MDAFRNMSIDANCKTLLAKLKKNRKGHAKIVAEARKGYIRAARKQLDKRLKQLEKGEAVALQFSLRPPSDHTKAYDIAIRMLELHVGETIELTATQVRNFEMDEWDWMDSFLVQNAAYSDRAKNLLSMKSR